MKQIRKISNLVAEELQSKIEESGIRMEEEAFEAKVSEIVNAIAESVEASIDEDVEVDDIYMAVQDVQLVSVDSTYDLEAGSYISIDGFDGENLEVSLFDEDGEEIESGILVVADVMDSLFDAEAVVYVEDEDVEESAVDEANVKAEIKLARKNRAKGKTATGNKKLKGSDLTNWRRTHKLAIKKAHSASAMKKASKTKSKRRKANDYNGAKSGSMNESVSKVVTEGFDINTNGMKIALESGDIMTIAEGVLSVVRDGKTIVSDVSVDEAFLGKCIDEGVVAEQESESAVVEKGTKKKACKEGDEEEDGEDNGEDDVDEGVQNASMLSFKSDCGYVLVKEGSEIPMGNRVRARAFLRNEGYEVSSDMLDKASNGELVTL